MNSAERREARYQRRKAERERKRLQRADEISDFDKVINFETLLESYKQVAKASKDHGSTQQWMNSLLINTALITDKLQNGTWKSRGFNKFDVIERGKLRHISSVHISEKGIQHTLSNNYLIPLLTPHLIYDNAASLKGKGTDFSLGRLTKHLHDHYRKYGRNGYIYFFDFKSYFASINTDKLIAEIGRYVKDDRLFDLVKTLIMNYKDGGLNLGSQVSQICAVFYPNKVDHLIKDQLGVHGYGRYMDDGYIICEDLDKLKEIIRQFEAVCEELDITLNRKKCQIYRLDRQFVFLKTRFFITESGKVVRRINRGATKKERRRLKAFKRFIDMGLMTEWQVYLNFHGWLLSLVRGKNYYVRKNMIQYYNNLFGIGHEYFPPKVKTKKQKELFYTAKGESHGRYKFCINKGTLDAVAA